jgi:multicomponent Na+:H+ antiporter subunit C
MAITTSLLYGIAAMFLLSLGLHGIFVHSHIVRKAISLNVIGTGIFLFLVALANRQPEGSPDPVPHGMVLTGIVVAVSATALILSMSIHLDTLDRSRDSGSLSEQKDRRK